MSHKKNKSGKKTSEKQIEANRQNALLSTGAQTIDGRNQSKYNAMRHNLRGARGLLPWESTVEYKAFSDLYIEEYAPATTLELDIIYEVAEIKWSLRRSKQYETDVHVLPETTRRKIKEANQLELYRGRLNRTVIALLQEFRRMRDERVSGKRVLLFFNDDVNPTDSENTTQPTASSPIAPLNTPPATSDPPGGFIRNEWGELCYPSGCPVNIRVNEHEQRHRMDVALGTMSGDLPKEWVDYARGDNVPNPLRHTAQSLPLAPQGDDFPQHSAPGNAESEAGGNPDSQSVSPTQMGSFGTLENPPSPPASAPSLFTRLSEILSRRYRINRKNSG